MSLHFKFRSAVEYDSVSIEGHFISVASLKEKIIEAKNLGKGPDFDLLITNAQSGEEYSDDAFLVPKNTSVIIKRVPAARAKPVLRVDDQPKSRASEHVGNENARGSDAAAPPPTALFDVADDSMDDFGVDLYAIPEPLPAKIDIDEDSRITAMVNKTASDWQRQTQEAFVGGSGRGFGRLAYGRGLARGRGYGRALPPQGYVCHRCGQPGHFIQHCPTNGDPAYDIRRVKMPVGIPKTRLKADQEGGYVLPDGSVAVMQPDETVFARETDALLSIRPITAEPPPELRCPLCQAIFKDAVMIPCCHYSFCDKCIRQELISKGACPQCGSGKFKNDDLLPNIALRQAIDRFLETQVPASSVDERSKPQQAPDVDPGSGPKPPVTRLQIELRKPAAIVTLPAIENGEKAASPGNNPDPEPEKVTLADAATNATITADTGQASVIAEPVSGPQSSEVVAVQSSKADENVAVVHPTIVKDESDPVKGRSMHPVIDDGGGMVVKMSEPPSHKEAEGVAVESEVSKALNSWPAMPDCSRPERNGTEMLTGRKLVHFKHPDRGLTGISSGKKKKKRARLISGDGAGDYLGGGKGKRMQGDRFCYICGSPEHLARDCLENPEIGRPPHPGMFGPGPPGLPHYVPEIYWPGPPVPQHGRPFPGPYGEGMYPSGPMPFDAPLMAPGPYNLAPYLPPIYHGAPMHGFMGGGIPSALVPMERPLSREEFMEMQEQERRRRLLHERLHRDRSPDRSYSRERNRRAQTPDSERRRYEHAERRGIGVEDQSLTRKREVDRDSIRKYSDETDFYRRRGGTKDHKQASVIVSTAHRRNASNSDDDVASFDELNGRKQQVEKQQRGGKIVSISSKKDSRYERDEDVGERLSSEFEDVEADVTPSVRRYEKRPTDGDLYASKPSKQSHSKRSEDSMSLVVSGVGGDTHLSRRRSSKRNVVLDGGKQDVEYDDDRAVVRLSNKHSNRRNSRSQDQNIGKLHYPHRHPVNELSGSELDTHYEIRESTETPRRRKHRSQSKAKFGLWPPATTSPQTRVEADVKKKKKKSKRHRSGDEGGAEKSREGRTKATGDHHFDAKHHKHRLRNGSRDVPPASVATGEVEQTRWQLHSGREEDLGVPTTINTGHRSKRSSKHRHSELKVV